MVIVAFYGYPIFRVNNKFAKIQYSIQYNHIHIIYVLVCYFKLLLVLNFMPVT